MRHPLRTLAIISLGAAVLGLSASAHAEDVKVSQTEIGDTMQAYYRGERTTAFIFVAIGAASAAAGGVLVATRSEDFARGLGWSMLSIGALEALGAGFYAFKVNAEIDHYTETLAKDAAQFKREEAVHIHGTVSRFFYYRLSEALLAVAGAGIATYGFASKRDIFKGVGIGIAAEAITFLALDSFGQGRAVDYEDQVRRFEPTVAFQVGSGERPWAIGIGSRF